MKLFQINSNLKPILEKVISGENLTEIESYLVMKEILSGSVPNTQMASLLTALRMKGESTDEIAGFVQAMRESMTKIRSSQPVIADSCGTGGDSKGTFNISTAAAFVVSGAGIPVAKHGNRSVSSSCGSSDVLEACGVQITMPKEQAEKCLNEIGITFLFAPLYHLAMKTIAPVRQSLGIRTVFNLLGPLVNPAGASAQVIGVAKKELMNKFADVCKTLNKGKNHSQTIVHESGYDEIVLQGKGSVIEVNKGKTKSSAALPKHFGLKKVKPSDLLGGNAKKNAELLKDVLTGKPHPLRSVVLANAALLIQCAARVAPGKILGLKSGLTRREATEYANESLESGQAIQKLNDLIRISRETSPR